MSPKLSLKTLYRSPVRTVLTFILLAAVTFALFSQIIEHAVSERELQKAIGMYYGTGAVEVREPYSTALDTWDYDYIYTDTRVPMETWDESVSNFTRDTVRYAHLTQEQINEITAMPYVDYTDLRYMTAGVSEKYERLDEGQGAYDYTDTCVIEGTISDISTYTHASGSMYHECSVYLKDFDILAGNPPWGERVDIRLTVNSREADTATVESTGNKFITSYLFPGYAENYSAEAVRQLNIGERYVFIVRYDPDQFISNMDLTVLTYLTDPLLDTTPGIWHIEGAPDNYLETEEYSLLKEYIDMVNTDIHTFDVVYTGNMDSILRVADGTIGIVDGRTITPEDVENGNMVCVISRSLSNKGLKVGDTITLKLGDKLFEQYRNLGAVSTVPGRMSENYTEVTLEIVGIYMDIRDDLLAAQDPFWSYSRNAIFVPNFLLNVPESELEGHTFAPGEFSFIVNDAWNLAAFNDEVAPKFVDMGLTLLFEDGGWIEISEQFGKSQQLSMIKIAVFSLATAMTICFAAFLYVVGRRRDYAIMRLLGTNRQKSDGALLLPLGVVSLGAVVVGTIAAVISTTRSIAKNEILTQMTQSAVNADIPVVAIILGIVAEILVVLFVAAVMLGVLGSKPPLELMQTRQQRRKESKKHKVTYAPEPENIVLGEWVSIEPAKWDGKKRDISFALKYVERHIRRTVAKALLFILVTVLLLNVAGQMCIMQGSYEDLFRDTTITSNFAGGLELGGVFKLMDKGFIGDVYYQASGSMEIDKEYEISYITTDIARFTEENVEITYADGYDKSSLQDISGVLVVGENVMTDRGWELGQKVRVAMPGKYAELLQNLIDSYHKQNGEPDYDSMTDEAKQRYNSELYEMMIPQADENYLWNSHEFVIVGTVKADTDKWNDCVYTPGREVDNNCYGKLIVPSIVEITLSDNNLVDEYREYAEYLASSAKESDIVFIMDTSKLDSIENNIVLMETLYPIIVTAILIVGAFMCGLIIVQNSLDIAIMRVLGTSKVKTRTILVLEQIILCIIGIIVAGIILYIRGALMQMLWVFGVYAFVILLASIVASVLASRKNVLELLQTKE